MIGIAPLRSQTSSWSGAGIMSATKLKQMIPSYGESLIDDAALCRRLRADIAAVLRLQNIRARRSGGALVDRSRRVWWPRPDSNRDSQEWDADFKSTRAPFIKPL
jgi:hypothetical protein